MNMSDTLNQKVRVRNSVGEEQMTVGELVRRYETQVLSIDSLMRGRTDAAVNLEAAATVMNVDGWTCDGHEPGAWCQTCKKMQLATATRMLDAARGRQECPHGCVDGVVTYEAPNRDTGDAELAQSPCSIHGRQSNE